MSRHTYITVTPDNREVMVVAGWDRPLQEFFMNVERCVTTESESDDPADDMLYSSLWESSMLRDSASPWSVLEGKLEEYGIVLPEAMRDCIIDDSVKNVGNHIQSWTD